VSKYDEKKGGRIYAVGWKIAQNMTSHDKYSEKADLILNECLRELEELGMRGKRMFGVVKKIENDYLEKYYDFKETYKERTIEELRILKNRVEAKIIGDSNLLILVGVMVALISSLVSSIFTNEYKEYLEDHHNFEKFAISTLPVLFTFILGIGFLYWLVGFLNSKAANKKLFFVQLIEEKELEKKKRIERIEKRERKLKTKQRKETT